MKRTVYVLVGLVVVIILIFTGLFLIGTFTPKNAAISIDTNPKSTVLIDGIRVGITPYTGTRNAGEIVVKLIPQVSDHPLAPFETKVTLVSGIKTVIRRDFGDTEETSSGEIISFEKTASGEVSLSVVSSPDSAQVAIDGVSLGFAPVKRSTTAGEHQLAISAPGYSDRTLTIQTFAGYKLTAFVKLAATSLPQPTSTPAPVSKTFVEILPTSTGFLRVREKPSITAAEVGRVKPGQKYPFVDEDSQSGWFEIEYLPAQAGISGKDGWVTNQYAKKVEETVSATSSATPSAIPK